MTSRKYLPQIASHLLMLALTAMIFYMFTFPAQVQAKNNPANTLPTLEEFIAQVRNGDANALRGTYIPGVLALPVVQQPRENSNYVSPMRSALTEFSMADKVGNVGLLAHNYLAGGLFFEIQPGDLIILVYGNARIETFKVGSIHQYEALPNGLYKNIKTRNSRNIGELFRVMYDGERHVTLQTCIAQGDNSSWGRLFVVAEAVNKEEAQAAAPPDTVVAPPPQAAVLPGIIVAPPPPAAPPVLVLGWPLSRFGSNINHQKTLSQP